MGFSDFVNKAKNLADQHDEQVDQGLDRVGDEANKRLAGHESQVDGLVDKGTAVHGCRRHHGRRGRPGGGGPGGAADRRARRVGRGPASVTTRP